MRDGRIIRLVALAALAATTVALAPAASAAQAAQGGHVHTPGMRHDASDAPPSGAMPTGPGQAAYGAIAEVVRILEADPSTDWSKVDIERLRQHLIDMNEVTLNAEVASTPVAGGVAMNVTGSGRTLRAIRAMVGAHAGELDRSPDFRAEVAEIPNGVRLTVTAERPDDARLVARIRALGFAGLMTSGDHHAAHHLAMARGGGH
jgi:hypothetical protein